MLTNFQGIPLSFRFLNCIFGIFLEAIVSSPHAKTACYRLSTMNISAFIFVKVSLYYINSLDQIIAGTIEFKKVSEGTKLHCLSFHTKMKQKQYQDYYPQSREFIGASVYRPGTKFMPLFLWSRLLDPRRL